MVNLVGVKFNRLLVIEQKGWYNNEPKWKCLCDYGNISIVRSTKLKDRSTKSCGCLRKEISRESRSEQGHTGFTTLYNGYRSQAKMRELEFNLTEDEFKSIVLCDCFYCGKYPEQISKPRERLSKSTEHGLFTYNGIDRLDNKIGYIMANCLPCCGLCNQIKMNLTYEEFYNQIKRINSFIVEGQIDCAAILKYLLP